MEKTPQIKNINEITLREFAELVMKMRHNQRRYERFHKPSTFEVCKELEKEVDDIIDCIFDRQIKLF